jgi:ATP-dependent DNA ligase
LIVQRDGKRVRLFTKNDHNWTDRYPLIVESALRNRSSSFVIDGEAVLLGVDGVSDFDGLHSRKHDDEVHHQVITSRNDAEHWQWSQLVLRCSASKHRLANSDCTAGVGGQRAPAGM